MEIALVARDPECWLRDPWSVLKHEIAVQIHRADFRSFSDRIQHFFFCKPLIKLAPNRFNAISAGGIAGFLAGVIGTGGAIRGLALAAFDLEKSVFVATSAAIDSGVDFSRMTVYLGANYLASAFYWYIPGLLLVAFVGSYLGKIALGKLEQKTFAESF